MDVQQLLMMLPGIQPEELMTVQELTKEMTPTQSQNFYTLYRGKRKDQQTLLLLTLIGFFGFAGIQRFVIGEIGMGVLYFLTVGFCGIGTIIDLVNHKSMAAKFNQKQAMETAVLIKMMNR